MKNIPIQTWQKCHIPIIKIEKATADLQYRPDLGNTTEVPIQEILRVQFTTWDSTVIVNLEIIPTKKKKPTKHFQCI